MNYNYIRITTEANKSIIGVNDGLHQVELNEKELKKSNIETLMVPFNLDKISKQQCGLISEKLPSITGFLRKGAKINDFMVFSPLLFGCDYIISGKVFDFLRKENIQNLNFSRVYINSNDNRKFYLMFVKVIFTEDITFEKSIINGKVGNKVIPINNYGDYMRFSKSMLIEPHTIAIDKHFQEYDLLNFQISGLFFSKVLFENIIQLGVTNFSKSNTSHKIIFI